ncbi:porwaprin-b-like [Alligator mississippiensis]|uniref:porwaprin-b-like n=1 Tax=Alligator mississippiensis TaxID=8496 RepID=UPI002877D855|nr:porwaprin-b-like [Alligator mississippiensis]
MKWGIVFLLVGLLALWAGLQPVSGQAFQGKPGRCPSDSIKCIRFEQDRCRHDGECWGRQKCCYSRCARRCMEPLPDGQHPGQGRCPQVQQIGSCEDRCGIKRACPRGFECCFNGCGRECMRVVHTEQPRE